jgi:hypothetical protein
LASESGQPVSALVLHLRAMHDEQSKRNKAKRKGRDAGKKPKGKEQDGGGGGKQQQDAAKKSKSRKKKNNTTKKPAPQRVLKAAASGGGGGGVAPSISAWNKG